MSTITTHALFPLHHCHFTALCRHWVNLYHALIVSGRIVGGDFFKERPFGGGKRLGYLKSVRTLKVVMVRRERHVGNGRKKYSGEEIYVQHPHRVEETRLAMNPTTSHSQSSGSGVNSSMGYKRPNTLSCLGRIRCQTLVPEKLNSLGKRSFSPLHFFFSQLFKEKGVVDPRKDARLVVDSFWMIGSRKKATSKGHSEDNESRISRHQFERSLNVNKASKASLMQHVGSVKLLDPDQPPESIAEDHSISLASLCFSESSSEHESTWHGSCRSIDTIVLNDLNALKTPVYTSPTSVMDMFGEDTLSECVKDPLGLMSVVGSAQVSRSNQPFDKGGEDIQKGGGK